MGRMNNRVETRESVHVSAHEFLRPYGILRSRAKVLARAHPRNYARGFLRARLLVYARANPLMFSRKWPRVFARGSQVLCGGTSQRALERAGPRDFGAPACFCKDGLARFYVRANARDFLRARYRVFFRSRPRVLAHANSRDLRRASRRISARARVGLCARPRYYRSAPALTRVSAPESLQVIAAVFAHVRSRFFGRSPFLLRAGPHFLPPRFFLRALFYARPRFFERSHRLSFSSRARRY
jgi:hypothetical protein